MFKKRAGDQPTVAVILVLMVAELCECMPATNLPPINNLKSSLTLDDKLKTYRDPSIKMKTVLFSKQGYYLAIDKDGNIFGSEDDKSPDVKLEAQSFGVNYKRFRKPDSWYLSISKDGRIGKSATATNETLFREIPDEGGWSTFVTEEKWVLAFRKNGNMKSRLRMEETPKKRSQFLTIILNKKSKA